MNAEENSITLSIVSVDQQEPKQGRSASKDLKGGAILSHTKEDEEEDEGVAQNGSMEDGDSLQSSTEAEKQDDRTVVSREAGDATERRNGRSSPNEVPRGHSHRSERPVEEEEERQKASNVAEMKSWLLERMQAPIKGRSSSSGPHCISTPLHHCIITASSLHHCISTVLHYCITPSLHYCITTAPLRQCIVTASRHRYITAPSLHHCISTSLQHCISQSLHYCIIASSLHHCIITTPLHYCCITA